MKKANGSFLGVACGLMALTAYSASPVYVNARHAANTGDGLTPETAFHTLREGIGAVDSGGTVIVYPGVYGEDEGVTVAGGHNNRVFIDKPLTLESVGGREVTHIVGKKDASTLADPFFNGVGPNAVRCILVNSVNDDVTIKGFTLRDGASGYGSDVVANWGGGISLNEASSSVMGPGYAYKTTLVDCTVRDCIGTRGGGSRKVRAVRTLYDNCATFNGTGTKNGAAARDGQFYWCVFRDCHPSTASSLYDVTAVNCTIVGSAGWVFQSNGSADNNIYNVYVALNGGVVGQPKVRMYSSVTQPATATDYGTYDAACKTDSDSYQLMAPALCDFRPIAGGDLIGRGNSDYLALIPEAYRSKDFLGHDIGAGDTLHVGAVQTAATPAGGRIDITGNLGTNVTVTLDGFPIHYSGEYAHAAQWPTQYVATVAAKDGKELWGWKEAASGLAKYPDLTNARTLFMPPATGVFSYQPAFATYVYYVNPSGSDENDGLTADSPFETLQKAQDVTQAKGVNESSCALVHVAEGTYSKGGYGYLDATNRLVIRSQIRFLGAGPGKSIIKGAADPEGAQTHSSCGSNAVRCVAARTDFNSAVQGFTLADGHSSLKTTNGEYEQSDYVKGDGNGIRGGGFYGMGVKACLIDCIVTNCAASRGGGAFGGRLVRCSFVDCEVMDDSDGNSIVRECKAWACTFFKVKDRDTSILNYNSKYFHCSLSQDSSNSAVNNQANVLVYNSLSHGRSFVGNGTTYFGCLANDPNKLRFVAPASGDMRITASSQAIGAGVATDDADYAAMCDWSMDGVRPLYSDGLPTAGAYQNPVRVFAFADAYDTTLADAYYIAAGESVEISPTAYGRRNPLGLMVDGTFHEGTSVTLSGSDWPLPCAREIPVSFVYSTNWYVNASKSDDSGDGFTEGTAKKTLAGIMGADVRSGDTVHAAAGVYAEGDMAQTNWYSRVSGDNVLLVRSRVVVPHGVKLKGAGRDVTFIKGRWDGVATDEKMGCGDNAIRCVCLYDGASLEGFTLLDGATLGGTLGSDNNVGGGVIAKRADLAGAPVIRDCTITNCTASRGGAGFGGIYVNCRIVGNRAWNNGTLRECGAVNCWFDGNRSAQLVGYSYGDIVNCTFTADNRAPTGQMAQQSATANMQGGVVANCVFLGTVRHSLRAGCHNRFAAGASYIISLEGEEYDVDNVVAEAGRLEFGEDGAPVIGSCIAVDGADATFYPSGLAGDRDCLGRQRVWNGRMDIGAVEADWRPVYARDLRPSRLTVDEASPAVVETVAKAVRLVDGAQLRTSLPASSSGAKRHFISVRVFGTGTITIKANDATVWTVVAADGDRRIQFMRAGEESQLGFDFAGNGNSYAEIYRIGVDAGSCISFR